MQFRLTRGLDIQIDGAPEQRISDEHKSPSSCALICGDFPRQRLTAMVAVGDRVRLAQALAKDCDRPEILHTSPGSGVVRNIALGEKRSLISIEVELDGEGQWNSEGVLDNEDEENFESTSAAGLASLTAHEVKQRLLISGLWTALRTRPFDRVPDPAATPHAIFVTAMDSAPLAAHAEVVLAGHEEAFVDGLRVIAQLTPGLIHLCQGPGAAIQAGDVERVHIAEFSGPHPAGLVGTHVHFLDAVRPGKELWYLDYQDVLAIGKLFTRGRLATEAVIALGGPLVERPRLIRTRMGANLDDLIAGELRSGECRVVSGSPLSGRQASGWGRFLGRYHRQVCVLPESGGQQRLWPLQRQSNSSGVTALHGRPTTFFPTGGFERVMPLNMLTTQLLRALLVSDTDMAQELGCLELGEEDLALCTYICPGKQEYGAYLRAALDQIGSEG